MGPALSLKGRGGFTLLEVLVALLLLSISIAAIARGYQVALRTVGASEDMARGMVEARSLLAAAEAGALPGTSGVLPDGSRWRSVNRLRPDLGSGGAIVAVEISIFLTTPGRREVALHSLSWTGQLPGG